MPLANSLLPDPTNVSRTMSQVYEEYREKLKNILKNDLQNVKLIGLSTDYWNNSGTSMLSTSLFDQCKTGDNTRKKIFSILSIYGIDPDHYHIVYITDNGSNLVCGLPSEQLSADTTPTLHLSSDDDNFDEVDRYVNTKISFLKDDALLKWWDKHSLIFPQLSLLAKSLLGVPASSATSERVFSSSGRVLENRRQSLSADIVDDILIIRNFRNM